MRLPSCLRQAMVHELEVQIEAVKAKIAKVEAEIEKVIERIDSRLDGPEMLAILVEREKGLRAEKVQLLANETLLLTAKPQPASQPASQPGALPTH